MTTNEPGTPEPAGRREPLRFERSRADRVLGGVCGGIARSTGVDPVLVRIGVVLLGLISGGAVVLAYLVAWVLLPEAAGESPVRPRAAGGAKEAWTAVGGELRSLATELRPKQPAAQPETTTARRPSLQSVDAALTGLGQRLRAPEVQEGARRTLAGFSAAVDASAGELGRRVRRSRPDPDASRPSRPDPQGPQP